MDQVSPAPDLTFTGHAAVFDAIDRAGDVVRAGAFGAPRTVPLLWQHRGAPVGTATVAEDARGLHVAGTVRDPEVARLVRAGAVPGLSVGYVPRVVHRGVHRELIRVDLAEVSLVAVPMQPHARIDRIDG